MCVVSFFSGIVLSWNMTVPSDCVEIASYQLCAYQETNTSPQTALWKKVRQFLTIYIVFVIGKISFEL